MRVRAAVIGCGGIAGRYDEEKTAAGCYTHAGAYRLHPEVELVAAADPDPARRAAFGRRWGVRHVYADARDLLAQHPVEIVSVCVPDALHEEVIGQVLAARPPKVIFAEKPLALGRHGARKLLDEAAALGVRIVLNNQRRWEAGHRQVRDLIRAGTIGQVVTVTAFYVKGLYHIGCTAIDTIRFLVGEVETVQALGGEHRASIPGDPSVDAALYLGNGATAAMLGVDRYGYRYSLFELDILATEGRVRLVGNGDRILVSRVRPYAHYPGFGELHEAPDRAIPAPLCAGGVALPIRCSAYGLAAGQRASMRT